MTLKQILSLPWCWGDAGEFVGAVVVFAAMLGVLWGLG